MAAFHFAILCRIICCDDLFCSATAKYAGNLNVCVFIDWTRQGTVWKTGTKWKTEAPRNQHDPLTSSLLNFPSAGLIGRSRCSRTPLNCHLHVWCYVKKNDPYSQMCLWMNMSAHSVSVCTCSLLSAVLADLNPHVQRGACYHNQHACSRALHRINPALLMGSLEIQFSCRSISLYSKSLSELGLLVHRL